MYTKDVVRIFLVLNKMKNKKKNKHPVQNHHLYVLKMNLKMLLLHYLNKKVNLWDIKYQNKGNKS